MKEDILIGLAGFGIAACSTWGSSVYISFRNMGNLKRFLNFNKHANAAFHRAGVLES